MPKRKKLEYDPEDLLLPEIDTDEPIAQAYGTNGNLTPGKKPLGGRGVRLSAYLYPPEIDLLKRLKKLKTSTEISRDLGDAVRGLLHDEGLYYVKCPNCGALSVELDVSPGDGDRWQCPPCQQWADFEDWIEV